MSTTDEIKSRIDIVELITASGVRLRKSGRNYTGFCPFHPNKHTPAFVVWPETGTWRCFGECNEGGDIFKFVMKKEGIDFREALTLGSDDARERVRKNAGDSPVLLKIAPDLSLNELDDVVHVARSRKVDGMIVANTTVSRHGSTTSSGSTAARRLTVSET